MSVSILPVVACFVIYLAGLAAAVFYVKRDIHARLDAIEKAANRSRRDIRKMDEILVRILDAAGVKKDGL